MVTKRKKEKVEQQNVKSSRFYITVQLNTWNAMVLSKENSSLLGI